MQEVYNRKNMLFMQGIVNYKNSYLQKVLDYKTEKKDIKYTS